jgi:hypothetical protein
MQFKAALPPLRELQIYFSPVVFRRKAVDEPLLGQFVNGDGQARGLDPKLPGWMFDENGDASFNFLSGCNVTYHNPEHKDTFGKAPAKIEKIVIKATNEEIHSSCLSGKHAEDIRNGEIRDITVYLQ